jgi:uncharacterized protein YndB with AHSA1/START domain
MAVQEMGSIEREIQVDAPPQVVFDVVSKPEHVQEWWSDQADFGPEPGSDGSISFTGKSGEAHVERFSVVEADPPHRFSFRWCHPAGEAAAAGNSFLVTFTLEAAGGGTRLTMTETGFREQGWEVAKLEEMYRSHVEGWDHFVPRLADYAPRALQRR